MPKRATVIHLSEKKQEELVHLTRRHRSEQQVVLRAHIILAAAQSSSHIQIARELDINVDTVRLWRDRWANGQEIDHEKSGKVPGSLSQRNHGETYQMDVYRIFLLKERNKEYAISRGIGCI